MKTYQIDEVKIEWGETLSRARALLEKKQKFNPHGGWPNIRCNCSEIFGLETTVAEIRAPFEDRPVMQVTYEIRPIKKRFFQHLHSPYLEQLIKVLGKPTKIEKLYSQPDLKKEYLWSAVVFSAKWLIEDVRISLSVYGGTRINDTGPSAGGIFINWINEIKAAKPFRQKIDQIEKILADSISTDIEIRKFKLDYKQRQFRVVHYELNDPYAAEHNPELRSAQMALYKSALFQTPQLIQDCLNDDEIGVYKIPSINEVFVSNRWDTISILSDNSSKMVFYEILPARGPGGKQLELVDLHIEDSRNSNSLYNLIEKLESYGIKVQKETRYDD